MKRCRFRELGFEIGSLPTGPLNAITDVKGVRVGHCTIRQGNGPRALNTGLTMILPHEGDPWEERVCAGFSMLNGCGEVTGREYVEEMGMLDGPIALTGTFNVPRVADAMIAEVMAQHPEVGRGDSYDHPFVAECSDALLSDMQARPIGPEHVRAAWHGAQGGPVTEGAVGAGTGTTAFEFKGGIGTSSRLAAIAGERFTVGVLVQTNMAVRELLRIKGLEVGRMIAAPRPSWSQDGSIILVVARGAPVLPRQLKRIAKRAEIGLARTGAISANGSGDFAIAFSTRNRIPRGRPFLSFTDIDNEWISPLFQATAEAAEEAILNSLCMAEDFQGRDGHFIPAIPLDELKRLLSGRR